jgi:hypothetical protein
MTKAPSGGTISEAVTVEVRSGVVGPKPSCTHASIAAVSSRASGESPRPTSISIIALLCERCACA